MNDLFSAAAPPSIAAVVQEETKRIAIEQTAHWLF